MSKRIAIACILMAAAVSAQEEKERPVLRVYDLSPLGESLPGSRREGRGHEFALLGASQQAEGSREDDSFPEPEGGIGDVAIEIIRTFVGDVEGIFDLELTNGGTQLVARLKESDQKIVAAVLQQMRVAGDPPVEIEVRHLVIPNKALDDATRAILLAPGGVASEHLREIASLDVRGGRQRGTMHLALGSWGIYRAVRELGYVPDFDVEIAQAASIADPISATSVDGVKAAVRPFVLRDGRMLLRIVASAGDRDAELRRFTMGSVETQDQLRLRNTDYSSLEQCDYRGCALSTEAVVDLGMPAVAVLGVQDGTELSWHVLTFTVVAAPKPAVADTFSVIPVGALSAADSPRAIQWDPITGELGLRRAGDPLCMDIDWMIERLPFAGQELGEFRFGDSRLYGGCILLRGPALALRACNETITALERELVRPARLDVNLVIERPGGERGSVGVLSAPLTVSRAATLAAYLRMDTVGDYDVEIAQEARIADPNHTVVTAGAFANATLFRNGEGGYRLEMDLLVSGAPEGIRISATRAGGMPYVQTVPLSKCIAPIRIDLVAGRTRSVDLGPDPFQARSAGRLIAMITAQ